MKRRRIVLQCLRDQFIQLRRQTPSHNRSIGSCRCLQKNIKTGTMRFMHMDMKQWVENWKRVGPILEQIEMEALRAPGYEDGLANFGSLLDWCCKHSTPKPESGLIEQQRLFMKMKQQIVQ
jgi:hypothetical protein